MLLDGPFIISEIALSPDGARLAFIRSDAAHPEELFVLPLHAAPDAAMQVTRFQGGPDDAVSRGSFHPNPA